MTSGAVTGPPPGTPPCAIITGWLPLAFQASGRRAPDGSPVVRLTISGTDPGDFTVVTSEDTLEVTPYAESRGRTPDVWIRQSAPDFLATFEPSPDLPAILPPSWSVLDLLFLDPRDVDLVHSLSGRILVEIAGKRRRRWALDAAFGPTGMSAGRPRSTVRLDGATYEGLAKGSIAPMQALLEGKIRFEGDRGLAMQAMLLVGSRLSR